jgi:hypothetical protein
LVLVDDQDAVATTDGVALGSQVAFFTATDDELLFGNLDFLTSVRSLHYLQLY